ncbi:MAG: S8 family peptidase [Chloroflexota bacterium]|nr:S8 family serine peptidase [Dehalococcoidia bacterium]MDW8047011.1 S8 family peptidase [Chloroflexota bacterium]
MIRRFARFAAAALAAAWLAGAGSAGPAAGDDSPPPPPAGYVVVEYDWAAGSVRAAEADPPPLDQRGFAKLPVPPGMTADEYARALARRPGIRSAVPDAPVYAARVPNDPLYPANQAATLNIIGAPQAWDLSTGREEVVVAVLDSGADLTHPDLAPRLWRNPLEIAGDGIDNDGNGCIDDVYGCRFVDVTPGNALSCGYTSSARTGNVADDNGTLTSASHSHGTLVAGIIGAAGNNGIGISGVAWNVRLMIVKVLDCGGATGTPSGSMFNVAQGIDYAVRMGARVINLSLSSLPGDTSADTAALRAAIEFAQQRGVIIVAAAGNWGSSPNPSPGYPAAYTQYPNVIGVGAMDTATGGWAPYSAWGPGVDLAAPGDSLASTVRTDLGGAQPYRIADRGTSFAAPVVSGAFALVISRNTRLSVGEYIDLLRSTASPAPPASHGGNWAGSGIVHAGRAVARVPALVTGNAFKDWKDIGPGVEVRARIAGIECGVGGTFAFGPASPYIIRIAADAEKLGCGATGRAVVLSMQGQQAIPTLVWPGPDADLGLVGQDISIVTPDPGPTVTQTVGGSWANIAHLTADGSPLAALSYLPPDWTAAYAWDPTAPNGLGGMGAFRRVFRDAPAYTASWETVRQYDAYWVEAAAPSTVSVPNPNPPPGRSVLLAPGWNNFVYTGSSRRIAEALQPIAGKFTQVLFWDNETGEWKTYVPGRSRFLNDFEALLKLHVYWIYVTEPVTLVMN